MTEVDNTNGTLYARTDTAGAYVFDGTKWRQLFTNQSLPAATPDSGGPVTAIAAQNPNTMYAYYNDGNIYKTTNSGATWVKTGFPTTPTDGNDNARTWGEKALVDGATVLFGTTNGLWKTTDGGATWSKDPSIPNGKQRQGQPLDSSAITGILKVGGNLFVASQGNGVYKNGAAIGGPSGVRHAATDGTSYYAVSDLGRVWKYTTSWQDITPNNWFFHSVAVDGTRITVADEAGDIIESYDGGSTWPVNLDGKKTLTSPEIPWISQTGSGWMSNGSMIYTAPNKLVFSAGAGVWFATLNRNATNVTWELHSLGIEQLVVNDVLATDKTGPLYSTWDFGIFNLTGTSYPSAANRYPTDFEAAWDAAASPFDGNYIAAAITDMRFCCGTPDRSGYSTDGGKTWVKFPTIPYGGSNNGTPWGFGTLAASQPGNIVWVPSYRQQPYYTTNNGATWSPVNLPGKTWPDTGEGLHWAYYLNKQIVAADSVNPGWFYLHDSEKGLYRTTNGGTTWSVVSPPIHPWSQYNSKLKSVPGKSGHLFFTTGPSSGDDAYGDFMRSVDGGTTWSVVAGLKEVRAFGFGKGTGTYPAIYVAGWYNGTYGIWASFDDTATWENLGSFPNGSLAPVTSIDADKTVPRIVYIGFGGNGGATYRG